MVITRAISIVNDGVGSAGICAIGTGAAPTAAVRVGESAVTDNTISWSGSGGRVLRSYGDNYIDGNGDGGPSASTLVRK